MKLLLINPRFPESLWSMKWITDEVRPNVQAMNPPLGLATLAALCPPDWTVEIIDENVEPIPLMTDADIVGVGGMAVQHDRQMELVRHFQAQGCLTVVGGSYASLCPEAFTDQVDVVISGEAEYIWPQFCRDLAVGQHKSYYREDGTVELKDSPTPRFELLKLDRYRMASLQFSRGCPFRCEFCDIIVMFGRTPRTKSPEQIGAELDALRSAGVTDVFFVDDNFIGHKPKAQELLGFLEGYQQTHDHPFRFGTEASTDLARHRDLMSGMRESGFEWVFLGIETPDPKSLAETKKYQNTQTDLLDSVNTIYHHGIDILAGFIVGFDNDTEASFQLQKDFLQATGIQMANVSMLQAMPKTPLYERLEAEGRLRESGGEGKIDVKLSTNIQPRGMSYEALVSGYRQLYLDLYTDEAIAERIRNKAPHLKRTTTGRGARDLSWLGPAARIISKGIVAGGPRRLAAAARAVDLSDPTTALQSLIDWGFALSVRSYLDRHFQLDDEHAARAQTELLRSLSRALRRGDMIVSERHPDGDARTVRLTIRSPRGLSALAWRVDKLVHMMANSPITLELDLRGLPVGSVMDRLLHRLLPYTSRVTLLADAALIQDADREAWQFNCVLPEPVSAPRRLPPPQPPVAAQPEAGGMR
ncbi:MAG: radical SAM protein [Myxococcota bacterium]